MSFSRKKILITGATGTVARPLAVQLAAEHEVWALARYSSPPIEEDLRAHGVQTWRWDLLRDSFDGLPADFTHVLHAAVWRRDESDYETAVEANSAAIGRLMMHCRQARSFIHISSSVVYSEQRSDHLYSERDPLGATLAYPVGKIAAEGAVRAFAAALGVPTVIARLNVAYGPYGHGGLPVLLYRQLMAGAPIPFNLQSLISPLHTDDIVRQVPLLWDIATSPALIVNWGGDGAVTIQQWVDYISTICGITARPVRSEITRPTGAYDNAKRRSLIGECNVSWEDGVRRTLDAHFPDVIARVAASS